MKTVCLEALHEASLSRGACVDCSRLPFCVEDLRAAGTSFGAECLSCRLLSGYLAIRHYMRTVSAGLWLKACGSWLFSFRRSCCTEHFEVQSSSDEEDDAMPKLPQPLPDLCQPGHLPFRFYRIVQELSEVPSSCIRASHAIDFQLIVCVCLRLFGCHGPTSWRIYSLANVPSAEALSRPAFHAWPWTSALTQGTCLGWQAT